MTAPSKYHESCRVCGSDEIIFNVRMIQRKIIRVRFCNACGAIDRLWWWQGDNCICSHLPSWRNQGYHDLPNSEGV